MPLQVLEPMNTSRANIQKDVIAYVTNWTCVQPFVQTADQDASCTYVTNGGSNIMPVTETCLLVYVFKRSGIHASLTFDLLGPADHVYVLHLQSYKYRITGQDSVARSAPAKAALLHAVRQIPQDAAGKHAQPC